MPFRFLISLLIAGTLLLTGCASPGFDRTPDAVDVLEAGISPALPDEFREEVRTCLNAGEGRPFHLQTIDSPNAVPDELDILFWWGDPALFPDISGGEYSRYFLTTLELKVLANPQNDLSTLTIRQLRDIFSGRISSWAALPESQLSSAIAVYTYPTAHPLQTAFQREVMENQTITNNALMAPSYQALVDAVQARPEAIGFGLPFSIPPEGIQVISVIDQELSFTHPVLAVVPDSPSPDVLLIVSCLQGRL